MKRIADRILYGIVYAWVFVHALLPLRVLYLLADVLYVLAYKVVGYRKKVVRMNLKNSFPEKTDKELKQIEKDFYHHLSDYFVETIKLMHISDKQMQKRMVFKDMHIIKDQMKGDQSGLMYLGHYGNWEWIPSITLQFTDNTDLGQIYRPLKSKAFDDLFLKLRSRFGSVSIAKNDTLRAIITMRRDKKKTLIGFMSDQTPSINNIHYWSNFLNQDTPVFTGVERIAKQTGFPVAYLDIEKVKRGYYTATVKLISADPKSEPDFAITERYIREMEKTILRAPAYWLWTHKRWKFTRERVAQILEERHKK